MAYEPANPTTVPASGRCQSGVQAFQAFYTHWWGLPSMGCYNPASVTPGGSPSLHRDGRAEDVGHDGTDHQIDLVWELCRRLTRHSGRLGVQQIIYRRLFWRQGQPWLPVSATTDPHDSHAHVEFLIHQSQTLTNHDFVQTLGVPPMDQETIDKLAAAIAKAFWTYLVPAHYYDTGEDTEITAATNVDFQLRELTQIRNLLTPQPSA